MVRVLIHKNEWTQMRGQGEALPWRDYNSWNFENVERLRKPKPKQIDSVS